MASIKSINVPCLQGRARVGLLVLLLTLSAFSFAQTSDEIFRQKETQKRYLLEQIVALRAYAGYLEKGYQIVGTGLKAVKDISKGELNLHEGFIGSLKNVSPAIRNSSKVAEIIALQLSINKSLNGIIRNDMSQSYQAYAREVRSKVLDDTGKDLDELLLIISSGKVEMNDDERIKRLDKIYSSMKDKSAFVQSFSEQVQLLIGSKASEQWSIDQIKKMYEKL